MRWMGDRESENIEDRRGGGMPMAVGGIGGIGAIIVIVVGLFLGVDPSTLMSLLNGDQLPQQQTETGSSQPQADSGYTEAGRSGTSRPPEAAPSDTTRHFVAVVLADTEDVWKQTFAKSGRTYVEPKLVLFSGTIDSACGLASKASGPFYCPDDQKVYLDLSFFEEMKSRFHAPGEFAEAYVIAHEVGHHVQNSLGILPAARREEAAGDRRGANAISVRVELQADCLAGVWAYNADRMKHIIENGDVEAALNAASAIGDDRLQMQARGTVVPDAFTHGSSAQRVRWFRRGLTSGDTRQCNTFAANEP
ncbi:MAG: zinc metallopeptidase [Alphaproteobacteria bacterium]|nr:zinc metallopeptidase [Alphaproteobacteria bacterium]